MRLLVVEDGRAQGESLQTLLRMMGHEVDLCEGRAEAIAKVAETKPDAFVIDRHLPDCSGLDLCLELLGTPELSSTPTVLVTAAGLDEVNELRSVLKPFGVQVVRKPFTADELLAALGVQ